MSTMTTAHVADCLNDFKAHLLEDAILKQRPLESYVKAWMGSRRFDDDCTREEFAEAVAWMAGERIAIRALRNTSAPVEFASPFR